ncbi:hypothetical protein [Antarctobacter jejuensis]|uniref:hypothetical protein n=1 Tax=Antarctobacter jejuensis TaxID=1439938 RepID=UPI003FD26874
MKRLAATLFCLLTLPAQVTQAADLRVVGMTNEAFDIQDADPTVACTHYITGQFQPGDGDRLVRAVGDSIQRWRDQGQYGVAVVCLDSPGGAVPDALKLAAMFRELGIGTKLEERATCESACALLFMAGSFHAHESGLYKWRVMHPTARLGFHAFDLQVPDGRYEARMVNQAYALAMETLARTIEDLMQNRGFEDGEHLKPSLVAAMLRTPPDRMMYVETVDQAGRWDIRVGPLRNAGLTMSERDFRRACANQKAWERDESATVNDYWQENFVNWTSEDWGDNVEVITNDMTGEGCQFYTPSGSARTKTAPLDQVDGGYLDLAAAVDPTARLSDLPY